MPGLSELRELHSSLKRQASKGVLINALSGTGLAMPTDPARPLETQTCDAAQARLAQVRMGSLLRSLDEQAEVQGLALTDDARLCDADQRDGFLRDPGAPKDTQRDDEKRVPSGQSRTLLTLYAAPP